MIKRLGEWLRLQGHRHAVIAAAGEGVPAPEPGRPDPYAVLAAEGEGLHRVAAQPELAVFGGVQTIEREPPPQVTLLAEPPTPLVIEPALGAMGHEVAVRMENVMTNVRLLSQLQFLDTVTVQAIDGEIVALEGEGGPGAVHLANLRVIYTMLSDALGYAGNMHRLLNIYNAAPSMHAAADYLLSLRPDPEQLPESNVGPFLPLAGGAMFGPLVLQADPRAPSEAATKRYTDTIADQVADVANNAVIRTGDTMTGPLIVSRSPPVELLEAVAKSYVDTLLSGVGYQGTWQVAANIPDLNPPAAPPQHGFRWLCLTADPAVPENAPAGMPGIGGNPISTGAHIVWDAPLAEWHYVGSGGLTLIEADARYLQLLGGTMLGPLLLDAAAHVQQVRDGFGYLVQSGGGLYKRVGGGVVLRQSSGNQQPQIEANNGGAARDIIDTTNGDARYAGRAAGWVNCSIYGGLAGVAVVRTEQNGTCAHLMFSINRGSSQVGNVDIVTVPAGYAPWSGYRLGFAGVNNDEGLVFYRLDNARNVVVRSGGASQWVNGDVTYRIA